MTAVHEDALLDVATTTETRLKIPGAGTLVFTRRQATGELLGIAGEGQTYLEVDDSGRMVWTGICATREKRVPQGMDRHVEAAGRAWIERYRWAANRLTEVDGVEVRRDADGRVVACLDGSGAQWFYSHHGGTPVRIEGPHGVRTIGVSPDGQVRTWREGGRETRIDHDGEGRRIGGQRPLNDHLDDAGRCWVTADRSGAVRHVFLWDGTRCLARIDGPVGSPLAAVFSLDPSATPVRVVTAEGVVRIPRDAYGEGLLAYDDVPGLFGGQVHGGLVHLPLRRLDPRTGSFCEPDPWHGHDDDPRRAGAYDGPLPVERDPLTAYEVCRGDPIGRADPTGGVSAGLVISDLTWSFQNNILTFFGVDWWFNLFASLFVAPFADTEFFSTTGISASDRRGGFGLRRGGVINLITKGRAFTTQHLVWSPDAEFEELQRGEVFDPGGDFRLTHYGTILALEADGRPRALFDSMLRPVFGTPPRPAAVTWITAALNGWRRHGGVGEAAAPGTMTPWFPAGGLHLGMTQATRHDVSCTATELAPAAVALGDLEQRTFLTAATVSGFAAGDRLVVGDATNLALVGVVGLVPSGTGERIQLDEDLTGLGSSGLTASKLGAVASSESRPAGALTNSLDMRGTTAAYAANDLLRLAASGGEVTIARAASLEARLPVDRPLPGALAAPFEVKRGVVGAAQTVTIVGGNLSFGTTSRPAPLSTGLVSGGGTQVAVRVESHTGTAEITVDVALPAAVTGAATITFAPVTGGAQLGASAQAPDAAAQVTYTPTVAGAAPDGSAGLVIVHCTGAGVSHARLVPAAPSHDVLVLDRAAAGSGPFTVERFPVPGPTANALSRNDLLGLVVPQPERFTSAPAVLLCRVGGDPPTPLAGPPELAGVNVAAGVITTSWPNSGTAPTLEVASPVLVGTRAAAIRRLTVTVTLDRPFDLAASGLRAVRLEPSGPSYVVDVRTPTEILVRPAVRAGGANVDWPFIRLAPGDLVAVTAGGNTTYHRAATVSGGVVGLVDGPALTPGAAGVRLRRADVDDPTTGGPFVGIDGTRTGSGATSTVSFDVWSAGALATGPTAPTVIGIVDGDTTHPATVVGGAQPLVLHLSESFDASGVDVARFRFQSQAFTTTLVRDGGVILLDPVFQASTAGTNLVTPPGESLVAVAYEATPTTIRGTIGPGRLLVPESEETEIDRGQSLADHELEHTLQYAKWGPLWFNLFPMLALELPGILATDNELPEYSRFLDGTLAAGTGSQWELTIPNTAGVSIAKDDHVQVLSGSRRARVKVTAVAGSVYTVHAEEGTPPTGQVSVRKQQNSTTFDRFYNVLDLLTHGGLVNTVAGTTWGGIFWLIGKGIYGLGRAIAGTGNLFPATVGTPLTISLGDDAGRDAIRANGRIVVRQGDNTLVRTMTRTGDVVTLTEPVTFTGGVQVAMYDAHDPGSAFDWYDYSPATIPSAANPAQIRIEAANGSSLSLAAEDRVQIKYRDREFRTDVLAVVNGVVELLDPITIVDNELSLRIAKVGSRDPLGNYDSTLMVEMGMGWMKWVFDPYGQIEYAAAPQQEWARWLLRVMRWLLGTQNFSLLPFGYLWWFRLFPIKAEHRTEIEQQSSEQSGDLYSPLGRLTGQRDANDFARATMVVGDVARYRYWPLDRTDSFVDNGTLDEPGVQLRQTLRVMPDRTGGGASSPPNGTTVATATGDPGRAVAEVFTERETDPRVIPATSDALGFRPSHLGMVPTSPRLQRTLGAYVAFTRPGDHRATTDNRIGSGDRAVDLHADKRQPLFFDITVSDVTVNVAGQTVAEGDTVTLVPFQRAEVAVTPNTSRSYRTTVLDPAGSAVVRLDGTRLVGVGPGAAEPVEVSRFYAVNGGAYGPGGLAFAGMHLSRELDIPVRRFQVDVVTTLPLRQTAVPAGTVLNTLAVDTQAFILVPAAVVRAPRVTSINGAPPPAGTPNPTRVDTSAEALPFVTASGSVFSVRLPAGSPAGAVVITVGVGTAGASTDLTCTFDLTT